MRIVLILLASFLFSKFSFSQHKVYQYHSSPNSLAEISLSLNSDSSFSFIMTILPEPMSNETDSKLEYSGQWNFKENWATLTFMGEELYLESIFDKSYADDNQFVVKSSNTISLNTKLDEIYIYGIKCKKSIAVDNTN